MAGKYSAGIVLFRRASEGTEVLIGHMGGPFWARKDAGAWSIPKGEYDPGHEEAKTAAAREFTEELGLPVPDGDWIALGEVTYGSGKSNKELTVWAVEADVDPAEVVPGTFEMEWPPKSGRTASFPEVDRVAWLGLSTAHDKLIVGQRPYLERLAEYLAAPQP